MENALAKRWMDFLAAEGFRPSLELNEDNTERSRLRFKAEGKKYSLYLDEEDPTFVHLELAYNLGDGRDLDQLARTANEVNESLKGAKTTVDADALDGPLPLRVVPGGAAPAGAAGALPLAARHRGCPALRAPRPCGAGQGRSPDRQGSRSAGASA